MWKNKYTYRKNYNGTLEERMSNKTIKASENECWPWVGSLDTPGYGCIRVDGKLRRATHIAYELYYGKRIPKGMEVMHSCDNRACVNPHHLSCGTKTENMQDKVKKGRANTLKGEAHKMAKLTAHQVQQIRDLFAEGGKTFTSIATIFNVTRTTIAHIVKGHNWK